MVTYDAFPDNRISIVQYARTSFFRLTGGMTRRKSFDSSESFNLNIARTTHLWLENRLSFHVQKTSGIVRDSCIHVATVCPFKNDYIHHHSSSCLPSSSVRVQMNAFLCRFFCSIVGFWMPSTSRKKKLRLTKKRLCLFWLLLVVSFIESSIVSLHEREDVKMWSRVEEQLGLSSNKTALYHYY